jgi:ATP-dependent exoDNAse (exonuclease V) alpha subunit
MTRKAKKVEESLEQAQSRWGTEAQEHEIEALIPEDRPVHPKFKGTAEQVLEGAIRHYSYRSVHFTRDEIREYAFKVNRTFTIAELDKAIEKHTALIDYGKVRGVDELIGHYTTAHALEREIRTIKAWMQGQGRAAPILDRDLASQALDELELLRLQQGKKPLKSGQRAAVLGTLASQNIHQVIHGLSGVGKTTALRLLKDLAETQGIEIQGFAPSIPAAKKLSKELDIPTNTVQKLVKSNIELKTNQLLIIDEGGIVSAEMLDVLMQKANAAGARVLLVGDTGQNQAIEAGSPMRSLMSHGAEVHHISEIIRQQNSIQKRAVELIARGKGLDGLSLLKEHGYINPIKEQYQRVSEIAAEYLRLSAEEQLNTLIVAGTNAEKDAIAAEIRAGLKANGSLGKSCTVIQLRDRALTPEQAKEIAYYRVGDYISLTRHFKRVPLHKDIPYQVLGKSEDELVVATPGGQLYRFDPKRCQDKQVFSSHAFDVAGSFGFCGVNA